MKNIQLIIAPSILGLKPTGVEHLPTALLSTGRLGDAEFIKSKITVPDLNHLYSASRDPYTRCLNPAATLEYAYSMKSTIEAQIKSDKFTLVLGGDCSILIGIAAALKSYGTCSLLYMDAHADFYEAHQSTTGEIADMNLSVVVGRGIPSLSNMDELIPYIQEKHVFHIGQRDQQEIAQYSGRDLTDSEVNRYSLQLVRQLGVEKISTDIINSISQTKSDGTWIHFDTDVIDDAENPAVDYRLPGGLSFEEVGSLIANLVKSGTALGLSITIFNPSLDREGRIAEKISDCISNSLR